MYIIVWMYVYIYMYIIVCMYVYDYTYIWLTLLYKSTACKYFSWAIIAESFSGSSDRKSSLYVCARVCIHICTYVWRKKWEDFIEANVCIYGNTAKSYFLQSVSSITHKWQTHKQSIQRNWRKSSNLLSSRLMRTSLSMRDRFSAKESSSLREHDEIASILVETDVISPSMDSTLFFIRLIVSVAEMNLL